MRTIAFFSLFLNKKNKNKNERKRRGGQKEGKGEIKHQNKFVIQICGFQPSLHSQKYKILGKGIYKASLTVNIFNLEGQKLAP